MSQMKYDKWVVCQTLMEPRISIEEDETLLRAATKMIRHNLMDLPVINSQGELVG